MKKILTYWWFAVVLDLLSTILFCEVEWEENPLFRNVWENYGTLGFIIVALTFGIIGHTAILLVEKHCRLKNVVYVAFSLLITFKVLIALTNMALIPYWVTGWFNF